MLHTLLGRSARRTASPSVPDELAMVHACSFRAQMCIEVYFIQYLFSFFRFLVASESQILSETQCDVAHWHHSPADRLRRRRLLLRRLRRAAHRVHATLFYNTHPAGCLRGSACTFSHAPNRHSVYDGLAITGTVSSVYPRSHRLLAHASFSAWLRHPAPWAVTHAKRAERVAALLYRLVEDDDAPPRSPFHMCDPCVQDGHVHTITLVQTQAQAHGASATAIFSTPYGLAPTASQQVMHMLGLLLRERLLYHEISASRASPTPTSACATLRGARTKFPEDLRSGTE
ncbi:hypothetical protein DFH06DRAFT_1467544 [Mycena polygramma]|nr:hypothetical protein DFH06DRAFT_1467544 [Mycena polygramma]